MNKLSKLLTVMVIMASILLPACGSKDEPAPVTAAPASTISIAAVNTVGPIATTTAAPTSTVPAPLPTATLAPDWKFTAPGAPNTLPVELREDITYVIPPENCALLNDLNQTCSTRKGQSSDGRFTLSANTAIRLTGDKVYVSQMGSPLMEFYNPGVKQTVWVVVNASETSITNLHLTAPHGHFRGYFDATNWDIPKIENMLGLALYQYIASNNPIPTPEPFGPTPVWNCESGSACENTNANIAIWDGATWYLTVGFYTEGSDPYWQQK